MSIVDFSALHPIPKTPFAFLFHYKCTASLSEVLYSPFSHAPDTFFFLATTTLSPNVIVIMLLVNIISLQTFQKLSSYGLWTHVNKSGSNKALPCPQRDGKLSIYLGLTYKETKAVWNLARGHTESQRKTLKLECRALISQASLDHQAISLEMRWVSCCFLLHSGANIIGQDEPRSSLAGWLGGNNGYTLWSFLVLSSLLLSDSKSN